MRGPSCAVAAALALSMLGADAFVAMRHASPTTVAWATKKSVVAPGVAVPKAAAVAATVEDAPAAAAKAAEDALKKVTKDAAAAEKVASKAVAAGVKVAEGAAAAVSKVAAAEAKASEGAAAAAAKVATAEAKEAAAAAKALAAEAAAAAEAKAAAAEAKAAADTKAKAAAEATAKAAAEAKAATAAESKAVAAAEAKSKAAAEAKAMADAAAGEAKAVADSAATALVKAAESTLALAVAGDDEEAIEAALNAAKKVSGVSAAALEAAVAAKSELLRLAAVKAQLFDALQATAAATEAKDLEGIYAGVAAARKLAFLEGFDIESELVRALNVQSSIEGALSMLAAVAAGPTTVAACDAALAAAAKNRIGTDSAAVALATKLRDTLVLDAGTSASRAALAKASTTRDAAALGAAIEGAAALVKANPKADFKEIAAELETAKAMKAAIDTAENFLTDAIAHEDVTLLRAALDSAATAGVAWNADLCLAANAKVEAIAALSAATSPLLWPPATRLAALRAALDVASRAAVGGSAADAAFIALADAERISALAAAGADVQLRRREAQAASVAWRTARKISALEAAGAKTIEDRRGQARQLEAYLANQRTLAVEGTWADADGMPLFEVDAGGVVRVLPSVGSNGAWKMVDEGDFTTTIIITLDMNRFSASGDYRGSRPTTITGVVAGRAFDGTQVAKSFRRDEETPFSMKKMAFKL